MLLVGAVWNSSNNWTATALRFSGNNDPNKPMFEIRLFRPGGTGEHTTEFVTYDGTFGSGSSQVYIRNNKWQWNAERPDVDHIWYGAGINPDAPPMLYLDAGLRQAALGGTAGNGEAMLEIYARTNIVTGAGAIAVLSDSGVGNQAIVTSQTGNVYLHLLRGMALTATAATTIPRAATLAVGLVSTGSQGGVVPTINLRAAIWVQEGVVWLQPGTAGAPSLTRETDEDTGLFWQATNALGFAIGGNEGARLSEPAADETALLVRRNLGGTLSLQRVSMGTTDSGGTGFRLLRVPN